MILRMERLLLFSFFQSRSMAITGSTLVSTKHELNGHSRLDLQKRNNESEQLESEKWLSETTREQSESIRTSWSLARE